MTSILQNNHLKKKIIRVAILDDHQPIIDGYLYRLGNVFGIEVVATMHFGEELEPALAKIPIDVLLLDIGVPTSQTNRNPYPIHFAISSLLQRYADLTILVISMYAQRAMIKSVMEAGASGYILKDDQSAIKELPSIIQTVDSGGIYLSQSAAKQIYKRRTGQLKQPLTPRQVEVLSLCAAYPDATTAGLAQKMNIANSTVRNLLSSAYIKLKVRNRAAAIAKARTMNFLKPEDTPPVTYHPRNKNT
ncbi:MAG: response regulator transcription factor [Anaerolineaceae bacterium]|nr:response regulator transcription factor [Anaerolineaceae bacterium]